MGVEYIYPEFEVVRNQDRCIKCRVCERNVQMRFIHMTRTETLC